MLLYVNIYGSYKLLKTVRFIWPTLYVECDVKPYTLTCDLVGIYIMVNPYVVRFW